jgi:hypothetical protein
MCVCIYVCIYSDTVYIYRGVPRGDAQDARASPPLPRCVSPPPQPERLVMRGAGVGQPKMCIPPGKILGTPLYIYIYVLCL